MISNRPVHGCGYKQQLLRDDVCDFCGPCQTIQSILKPFFLFFPDFYDLLMTRSPKVAIFVQTRHIYNPITLPLEHVRGVINIMQPYFTKFFAINNIIQCTANIIIMCAFDMNGIYELTDFTGKLPTKVRCQCCHWPYPNYIINHYKCVSSWVVPPCGRDRQGLWWLNYYSAG